MPGERPVRRATLLNVSWSERDRSVRGAIELTLRDDEGEYVLQAAPEDADALLAFLDRSREVLFELGYRMTGVGEQVWAGRPGPSVWAEASLMHT